ncbi:MAG: hypothetical protein JNK26_03895 [Candidatus Doudnabacteria bacterium]|nr:hypothetical protein [Candidatus Doudnabacteria bacterium]
MSTQYSLEAFTATSNRPLDWQEHVDKGLSKLQTNQLNLDSTDPHSDFTAKSLLEKKELISLIFTFINDSRFGSDEEATSILSTCGDALWLECLSQEDGDTTTLAVILYIISTGDIARVINYIKVSTDALDTVPSRFGPAISKLKTQTGESGVVSGEVVQTLRTTVSRAINTAGVLTQDPELIFNKQVQLELNRHQIFILGLRLIGIDPTIEARKIES